MKQAYTNTRSGQGAGRPLTIATGRRNNRQQLPKCAYGSSCNRKGCAFWHPPPSDTSYDDYHDDPRSKICKPYLAGLCTYGHRCKNRHPSQEEADAVRATYKEKSCSYGDDCQTEGCLYWHPWEAAGAAQHADHAGEQLSSAMGGLQLEGGMTDAGPVPTYEQWLALNCPPPPTIDESHIYAMWHYPGSGMQRSPWEVYCLMYPQHINSAGTNLNQTTWETSANIHGAPQAWEPTTTASYPKDETPKSFLEWKRKGQPYPSWFNSDLDPWYDDEGMRRSLEEVYEVLYGENAEEIHLQKLHEQSIANDPTPAELAALTSTNDSRSLGTSPVVQPTSAKGGWASIAAKKPVPVQKPKVTSNGPSAGNQSTVGGESSTVAADDEQKRKSVVIPKEVWLPSTANSDCFHMYPNPIERFNAVNAHHKSYLASITIPKCFDSSSKPNQQHDNNSNKGGKVTLLDVHFQSAKNVSHVLNRFLTPALKKNDEVWVVTGSGQHVAAGHQRRESGGVLFNAVKRYLEEREEENALEFRIGKDTSGGKNKSSGGAFLVRKVS